MPTVIPRILERSLRAVDDNVVPFTGNRVLLYPYVGHLDLDHDDPENDSPELAKLKDIHREGDVAEDRRYLSPVETEVEIDWPNELVKTLHNRIDLTNRSEDPEEIELTFRPSDFITEGSYFKVGFSVMDTEDRTSPNISAEDVEANKIFRIKVNELLVEGQSTESSVRGIGAINFDDEGSNLHPDDTSLEAQVPTDGSGVPLLHESGPWPATLDELQG